MFLDVKFAQISAHFLTAIEAEIINNTSSGRCFDYDNSTDIVQYLESSKYAETINFEKYSRKNLTLELVEILEKMIDDYNK